MIGTYGDRFDHYERLRGHLSPPQPRRKPDRHPGMGVSGTSEEALRASEISTKNKSRVGWAWGRQPVVDKPTSPFAPEPCHQALVAVLLAARTQWGNELRTASKPCCVGTGDGAGGSPVVGLDPDAGLNAVAVPSTLLRTEPRRDQYQRPQTLLWARRSCGAVTSAAPSCSRWSAPCHWQREGKRSRKRNHVPNPRRSSEPLGSPGLPLG